MSDESSADVTALDLRAEGSVPWWPKERRAVTLDRILELEFVSGDVYRYWVVPARVWRELWEADSAGHYFTTVIRDAYPTEKVR